MIVVVDSTVRGPSLGGCRWLPYQTAGDAMRDAVDLAAAMTKKAALAELPLGGGKAVVRGDPTAKTRDQLHALGALIESVGGDYIAAEDMGTSPADMAVIAERTSHVVGLPTAQGGSGNPAPTTASGVYLAMQAALKHVDMQARGARVAIQGAGAVGSELARLLVEDGASVLAADTDEGRLAALPAAVERVGTDNILTQDCDVLAPCGPPGVIDDDLAGRLRCRVVCGAANNPLAGDDVARTLAKRGVLYVPDFLANAGGIIHLSVGMSGGTASDMRKGLEVIPRNFEEVMARAEAEGSEPLEAAVAIARERLLPPE